MSNAPYSENVEAAGKESSWIVDMIRRNRHLRNLIKIIRVLPALAALELLRLFGVRISIYPDQFGHQAFDVEYHLRKVAEGASPRVFLRGSFVPNTYLLGKHQKLLRIAQVPDVLIAHLCQADLVSRRTWGRHKLAWETLEEKLLDTPVWNETPPQILFTPEEHERGQRILDRLGLEYGRYVCMHARDSAFPLKHNATMLAARDRRFGGDVEKAAFHVARAESSRYQQSRNMPFTDYAGTLDRLAASNLVGVRMGAEVEGDLENTFGNLVDFGGRHRSYLGEDGPFADIYLMAHCRFCIGTGSGITHLGYIFNRPTVYVNTIPWPWANIPPLGDSIYIPKLLRGPNGILSFCEMIDMARRSDWRIFYNDSFFLDQQITPIDNSPNELTEVVDEMCCRLDGTWMETDEDHSLQLALMRHADDDMPIRRMPSRIGVVFLRRYRDLLD